MHLSNSTVLEIGEYVATPYAGKVFSDLGADVIKVEPPGGDIARQVGPFSGGEPGLESSGFFGYLNTGKKSVTLAQDDVAPRIVRDLVEAHGVDVVIGDADGFEAYGIDPAALADDVEPLSVVSVSDFGATGPRQEDEAPDLVAWAESGHMNKCGYPESPPTRPRVKSVDYWAGEMAYLSATSALLYRDLQGGSGQFVDLSKREAGVSAMEHFIAGYSWAGETTKRTGHGYPHQDGEYGFPTIFEAADGYFSAAPTPAGVWEAFCEYVLEEPELAEDERLATQDARQENIELVEEIVTDYTKDHGKWELLERFQEIGIPSAVTTEPREVVEFEHLHEREFWQDVELPNGETVTMPGFPFRPGGPDNQVEMERAPCLGEHDGEVYGELGYDPETLASTYRSGVGRPAGAGADVTEADLGGDGPRPLEGVTVLDFTWVYAGPQCTKFLAALGADVVKVESMQKPDVVRIAFAYDSFEPGPENPNVSAYFNEQNQGKRSINIDMTTEEGREIAMELAKDVDVIAEAFSPTFMERIDFTYEDVREVNDEIVYLSMPGWAKTGPAKGYRSFGLNLQSMAGMDAISGHPDDPPTTGGLSWPDPTAGYLGAMAVASALLHREETGEGGYIELPQYEATVSFMHKPMTEWTMNGHEAERVGNRDEDKRFVQGAYPCAGEDRWAVVAVETDAQWRRLCDVIGRPDLAEDERFSSQYDRLENHDAVDEVIEAWTRERTREEVRERLQDHDVPAGIVADERDLVDYDEQLRVREYFSEHDHPEVGERTYQGVPFKMSECDVRFPSRAPLFGEHTEEVLAEWLGMSGDEIREKQEAQVLF